MNNKKYNKLKPYLAYTGFKSKVMIYLIANGTLIEDIINLKVKDLMELPKATPSEILEAAALMFDKKKTLNAFHYPSGRKYNQFDILRILKNAHIRAKVDFSNVDEFRKSLK